MDEEKKWYASSTIWASLGTVLVSLLSVTGHQVDPSIVPDFAQQVALLANALTALWAIRGRLAATAKIA
jgi:hypothetical protein